MAQSPPRLKVQLWYIQQTKELKIALKPAAKLPWLALRVAHKIQTQFAPIFVGVILL